jgi:hypothetical protein
MKAPDQLRVDEVDAAWGRQLKRGDERHVLSTHPWVGRRPLSDGPEVAIGSTWTVCTDLVAEADPYGRPKLRLRFTRRAMRYRGLPVDRERVERLHGYFQPLVLIRAGTILRLFEVGGWVDWQFESTGSFLHFTLPDGRQMPVTVEQWDREDAGLSWMDLLMAAMVVPLGHPLAGDDAARDATITRIERAAGKKIREPWGLRCIDESATAPQLENPPSS